MPVLKKLFTLMQINLSLTLMSEVLNLLCLSCHFDSVILKRMEFASEQPFLTFSLSVTPSVKLTVNSAILGTLSFPLFFWSGWYSVLVFTITWKITTLLRLLPTAEISELLSKLFLYKPSLDLHKHHKWTQGITPSGIGEADKSADTQN